jgi:hypothetical protein
MQPSLEQHLLAQTDGARRFFWHRLRWLAVAARLPAGAFTLVDVGAGAGLLHDYLRAERPEATYRFSEPLDTLRSALRARAGDDADWTDRATYADARVVALLDVLEHQPDDRAFLTELAGRMAPGTRLIVTVPALPLLWSAWDVGLGHHRRYTRRSLRAAFDGTPFAVERVEALFPEMLPAGLLRRFRFPATKPLPQTGDLEFPELSPFVNAVLFGVGRATLALRRIAPFGTSVLAVAERR